MDQVVAVRRIDLLLHLRRIDDPRNPRHTATYLSVYGDAHSLTILRTNDLTTKTNELFKIVIAQRILSPIIRTNYTGPTTETMTNPDTPFLTCPVTYRTSCDHPMIDLFGESCFHVDNSGVLTTEWNDHLRSVWLNIIRRAGLRASAETPHLLHDSQKRPDVKVRVGKQVTLLDVRTSSTATTGTDSTQECAATPSYSAEMGAKSKYPQ